MFRLPPIARVGDVLPGPSPLVAGSASLARMTTISVGLSAAVSLAGLGAGVASKLAMRRWSENPDPTAGEPLELTGLGLGLASHDGARLHVFDQGLGHPVVLAPGWTGQADDWAPVIRQLLDAGYRVIAYDRRGHGRSTQGSTGFTVTNMGLDLRTIVEACDVRDATIVGQSLGGVAAMMFAIDHGPVANERVRNLVLASATACWSNTSAVTPSNLVEPVRGAGFDHRTIFRSPIGPTLLRGLFGKAPNLRLVEHSARRAAELDPRVLVDVLSMVTTLDISDQLRTITQAVRVVCGREDRITPVADSEVLARSIPASELHVVEGAGHMLPWESPSAIVDAVRQLALASG